MPPDAALGGFVGLMPGDSAIVTGFAMQSPAQHQPFVDTGLETVLVALVSLEIVGRDSPRRTVDQVGLAEPALVNLLRRAFQQSRKVVNDGLVDADRLDH